jgi:hypothetical protein
MLLRLGIDIACRDAPQVSLADKQGQFIWTGRRFAPHRAGTSRRADHRNLERIAVDCVGLKLTPSTDLATTTPTPRPELSGRRMRYANQKIPFTATQLAPPAQFPGAA